MCVRHASCNMQRTQTLAVGARSPCADVGSGLSQSRRRCGQWALAVPAQMWAVAEPTPDADEGSGAQSRCGCGQWWRPVPTPETDVGSWGRRSPRADVGRIEARCGGAPCPRAVGCLDGLGHSCRARACTCMRVCTRVCLYIPVRVGALACACVRACRRPDSRHVPGQPACLRPNQQVPMFRSADGGSLVQSGCCEQMCKCGCASCERGSWCGMGSREVLDAVTPATGSHGAAMQQIASSMHHATRAV